MFFITNAYFVSPVEKLAWNRRRLKADTYSDLTGIICAMYFDIVTILLVLDKLTSPGRFVRSAQDLTDQQVPAAACVTRQP